MTDFRKGDTIRRTHNPTPACPIGYESVVVKDEWGVDRVWYTDKDGDVVHGSAANFELIRHASEPASPETDIKAHIADTAKSIVSGARRSAYGTPEQNFERIARLWNGYLVNAGILDVSVMGDPEAKGGITPGDVSLMMALLKIARLGETPDHYDSYVDLVGYALTGAEVNKVEKPA